MAPQRISVLGGGAWGCALANVAARAGRDVTLWTRNADAAHALAQQRRSPKLADAPIESAINVTSKLHDAADADAILLCIPAQQMRVVLRAFSPRGIPLISCAKGIERGTHQFMTQVIAECAPDAVPAILSGPSFASDVAKGLPTAVTLACENEALARDLAQALGSLSFRPYHSTDMRGVEVGGATKNVLAIAAGIVSGKGLGASAIAAMTTRGFAEMIRFGRALGGKPETMMGLSGLGDLILSCSSTQSRNFAFGFQLGQGRAAKDIHAAIGLAEGAFTAPVLLEMAQAQNIDMPITAAVAAVLDGGMSVDAAIGSLMTRPFKAES